MPLMYYLFCLSIVNGTTIDILQVKNTLNGASWNLVSVTGINWCWSRKGHNQINYVNETLLGIFILKTFGPKSSIYVMMPI